MIPSQSPHVVIAALSHPGEVREINEDRYSVAHYWIEPEHLPLALAIVADGIGGHQAGEVASQITVDVLTESISQANGSQLIESLEQGVIAAGRSVMETARSDEKMAGMGSTVAVVLVVGDRLYTVTVGDSRIYLLRNAKLRQISVDHTWVQEAINHGILTPEEARNHPNAHVLHRHLGGEKDPLPDFRLRLSPDEDDQQSEANQGMQLQLGDRLLLCSDGLTDLVEDDEIRQRLTDLHPKEAVAELVDLARSRGGHDNITVVSVMVPEHASGRGCLGSTVRLTAAGIALLALTLIGLGLIYWLGLWPW